MKRTLSRIIGVTFIASMVSASMVSGAEVTIAPQAVTVGDLVEVQIEWPLAPGEPTPQLPNDFNTWGMAEVVNAEPIPRLVTQASTSESEAGASQPPASARFRIELRSFRVGTVTLPPLALVEGVLRPIPMDATEPTAEEENGYDFVTPTDLRFEVSSVLPPNAEDGSATEPRPLAPPRNLERRYLDRWLLGLLAATALGLLWAYFRRRSQKNTQGLTGPSIPPFQALLRELQRLRQLDATETVHVDLSLALRHYLASAVGVPAPERTTSEIRRSLVSTQLSPDVVRRFGKLLRACDEVKFARLEVSSREVTLRLDEALGLGKATEEELETLRVPLEDEVAA